MHVAWNWGACLPLLDVANIKRIAAVIAAGRLLRQADLERLKAPPKP
jgi:hypothetical protein